jgi:hypothetical protein
MWDTKTLSGSHYVGNFPLPKDLIKKKVERKEKKYAQI